MGDGTTGAGSALHDLRTLFAAGATAGLTDAALLDRFLGGGPAGETAFAAIVARHGPTVWRVCRAALADPNDAADAFQATFLVLVRRAGSVRRRQALGSWLFGVARRVSLRARADAARRRRHEQAGAALADSACEADRSDLADLAPLIHEEVGRLPERFRAAVLLCDLEGQPYEAAARALGCPTGTLKTWLSRGRARLRTRLTRRGFAPPAGVSAAAWLASDAHAGPLPAALARATSRAAVAPGRGAALTLAVAVLRAARAARLSAAVAGVLGVAVVAGGLTAAAPAARTPAAQAAPPATPPAPAPTPAATFADAERAARAIDDPTDRALALLNLGRARVRRKETEAGRRTLREAAAVAATIPPNTTTHSPHPIVQVASAQADTGDREAARSTFREAIRVVSKEDRQRQQGDWINLVASHLKFEGPVGAAESVAAYRRYLDDTAGQRGPFFDAVERLRLLGYSDDYAGVLNALADDPELKDPENRKRALIEVVTFCVDAGDAEAAAPVIDEARRAIEAVDVGRLRFMRTQDLAAVAKALIRAGRIDDAMAVNSEGTTKLPLDVPDDGATFNQALAFADIAAARLQAGDRAGALATARRAIEVSNGVRRQEFKMMPFYRAMVVLGEAGAAEEALGLSARLGAGDPLRVDLYVRVGDARAAAGDAKAADAAWAVAETECEAVLRDLAADPGPEPDRTRARALGAARDLARTRARRGRLDDAIKAADALPAADRDEALADLAADRARAGDLTAARAVLRRVSDPKSRGRAVVRVACALPAQ